MYCRDCAREFGNYLTMVNGICKNLACPRRAFGFPQIPELPSQNSFTLDIPERVGKSSQVIRLINKPVEMFTFHGIPYLCIPRNFTDFNVDYNWREDNHLVFLDNGEPLDESHQISVREKNGAPIQRFSQSMVFLCNDRDVGRASYWRMFQPKK